MAKLQRKTRKQVLKEKMADLMRQTYREGFLVSDIGWIFKRSEGRVSQILNLKRSVAGKNKSKKT